MVNCQVKVSGHRYNKVCQSTVHKKGTVTIAENAWLAIEWYTKQWRHLSYLSSYKTVIQ